MMIFLLFRKMCSFLFISVICYNCYNEKRVKVCAYYEKQTYAPCAYLKKKQKQQKQAHITKK